MAAGRLESIQVGLPVTRVDEEGEWTSAVHKHLMRGAGEATTLGLLGDGQANTVNHGGPDKALLAYAGEHFLAWRDELGCTIPAGGLGDNLTLSGLNERTVCIGDQYRVGDVVVEVTQPRKPCWKLGRLWGHPQIAKRVVETDRCGWYLRVIEPGRLKAGDAVELVSRPHPDWSIVRANRVMFQRVDGEDLLKEARHLVGLPELSASWRDELAEKYLRAD
ncbi:MAG: MOSC domain-containing protein [Planctomycetaceae bacterium]